MRRLLLSLILAFVVVFQGLPAIDSGATRIRRSLKRGTREAVQSPTSLSGNAGEDAARFRGRCKFAAGQRCAF